MQLYYFPMPLASVCGVRSPYLGEFSREWSRKSSHGREEALIDDIAGECDDESRAKEEEGTKGKG